VPKKPGSKPQAKAVPQFDCDPVVEDDEPVPFTLDDDGNMALRRSAAKPRKELPHGKGKGDKPAR